METGKLAVLLPATLVLAGCVHSGSETQSRPSGVRGGEAVVEGKASVKAVWVAGDRVYGLRGSRPPEKLAAPVRTTLLGTLSPAAVADPSGSELLAYNSWRGKRPVLRLHDAGSGEASLLDQGAFSLAWRRDGVLAYFKALEPDVRSVGRYLGHVVVRRSRDVSPVRWTSEAGRYVVAAWARQRLLVYRIGKGWPDLLVLDGPARPARLLARAGALVALNPDGRRAFIATYGSSPPVVRVLDIARGSVEAASTLRRGDIRWVIEAGSWSGERVVATVSGGLAVFRARRSGIVLEQVVRFRGSPFPTGVFEPQIEASGERVVAWAELESRPREAIPRAVVLECDRVELRCVQGPSVSSALGPRLVYNPSRP